MRRWLLGLWGLLGLLAAFGLALTPALAAETAPPDPETIAGFQAFDQRLQDLGWGLVRGNARFCGELAIPSIGLQVQDMSSYGRPDTARRALGLTGDFAVQNAAKGSPAALSGAFTTNREIIAIAGVNPNDWPVNEDARWQRFDQVHDFIDAALKRDGAVTIGFADGEEVRVIAVPVCATRFELLGKSDVARSYSITMRVRMGTQFSGFRYGDDVLVAVLAHELGHNLMDHTTWRNRNGRRLRHMRATEREADRLMPWLLANAGYDPLLAQQFMEGWMRRHGGGLLRNRSHEGWDERAEHIAAEIPLIRRLMAQHGGADWRTHFRREIDPSQGL